MPVFTVWWEPTDVVADDEEQAKEIALERKPFISGVDRVAEDRKEEPNE